ncbi:MAG: hypothetical protein IJH94_05245 [Clostridia bacterium]|nr:hypothetical protein [Clostridia bacterium]
MEESNAPKNLVLKVIGLVVGIIAAIVLAAVLVSVTVLPGVRYNMAAKLAAQGDYETAAQRLKGLDYKDSQEKLDEYASIVVKTYIDAGEKDKAVAFLRSAYELTTDEQVQHATEILNAAQNN